jgi:hypothetical protein
VDLESESAAARSRALEDGANWRTTGAHLFKQQRAERVPKVIGRGTAAHLSASRVVNDSKQVGTQFVMKTIRPAGAAASANSHAVARTPAQSDMPMATRPRKHGP